ncbi:MAG: hypothetical protein C0617_06310 [Desulfuromonas sp.]|uniref:hypothetical protein n=1 Tax=Desulfuromonas sp. TaxID=892 RepID=UPI000CA9F1DF|nr:hypothetical protein [Desulfuromonas sp.]PLX84824.1 MAG: hypothetical protein C0617_06310 [Desulfuromonas sp.]
MGEKGFSPRTENACTAPAGHRDHMCLLMEKGLTEEVALRSTRPAYACGNCGALANEREDLCNPAPL